MNKPDRMQQIMSIKALRKRKAEIRYLQATAKAEQVEKRATALRERHLERQEVAKSYMQNRFMQLQESDNIELFFTTATIGLLRQRKEVASLSLRSKRLMQEHQVARKEQRRASAVYARASMAEKLIGEEFDVSVHSNADAVEQDTEEDLLELLQLGVNRDD
jgi:hypothetical protein